MDCSEELGDLVRQYDVTLALSVYYIANARDKVIQCLAESGQYDRIILYAQKVRPEGYVPDWMYILNGLMQTNPPGAASFATKLLSSDVGEGVDVNQVSLSLSLSLSLSVRFLVLIYSFKRLSTSSCTETWFRRPPRCCLMS